MQAVSMTSQTQSIRSLIAQVSGLIGLFVFLNLAWSYAPLERTLLTAFGAGLATYVVLVLGYATVQRILAYSPPDDEEAAASESSNQASEEVRADETAPSETTADKTKATKRPEQVPDDAASPASSAPAASPAPQAAQRQPA